MPTKKSTGKAATARPKTTAASSTKARAPKPEASGRQSDPALDAAADSVTSAQLTDDRPAGGETHQHATGDRPVLTTQQGVPVADFFQATCAACHGADRAGIPGLGLPLTPDALTEPDDFYFNTIAEGRPGTVMPSWRANGLTDEEIQTLVEFITTVEP